jgi:branched-chain amino acid transport system substrate-binding protein
MKRLSRGLAALGLVFLMGNIQAQTPGVTDNEIVIGLFGPLSGPLVAYGVDPLNAARMVYDDINAKGGINGRKIRLVIEDDKCNPNELVAVVKKLITVDKVFLLHGGSCTAAIAAAQEYVVREKVPYVMLNAAGDNAVFPATRYMFGSFQATQRVYGSALAEYAVKGLGAKRIAIIVHDDDYGKANLAASKAVVERLGGTVVAQERIPPNITDITAPVLNIRAAKPDAILSGAYPAPAVLLAQKYGEFGMSNIPLMQANQGIPTPSVYAKNVGNPAALKNLYHTWAFNDISDAAVKARWTGMYKKHFPDREPGPFMVTGLPSVLSVVDTLQRMGREVSREKFVDTMEKLNLKTDTMTGPLQFAPGRRDALRSVVVVKYDGVTQKVMPGVFHWNGKDGN